MLTEDQKKLANLIRIKTAKSLIRDVFFGAGGTETEIMALVSHLESFQRRLERDIFGSDTEAAKCV